MALGTRNMNMNLHGESKHTFNNENVSARLGGKSIAVQKPAQRAALGNISNVVRTAQAGSKKVVKRDTRQKAMTKTKATSSLHAVVGLPVEDLPTEMRTTSPDVLDAMEVDQAIEAFSQQLIALQVEDIDKDDGDNPQLCSEYAKDIYLYLRRLEVEMMVPANYLDRQETQITGRMRLILVDWLVQVHLRFHLLQETLFLTVQLIDRFLAEHSVSKGKLQLVGVTAMFIASKYEEMYPPEINDFVYITDNAYTKAQIRQMEIAMLKGLKYKLGKPLCLHFLRRNSKAAGVNGISLRSSNCGRRPLPTTLSISAWIFSCTFGYAITWRRHHLKVVAVVSVPPRRRSVILLTRLSSKKDEPSPYEYTMYKHHDPRRTLS